MSEEIRVQRDVRDLDPSNSRDTGIVSRTGAAAATAQDEVVESRTTEIRPATGKPEPMTPLFSGNETQGLHSRWETLQVSFVDEPRHAVEEAERLVTETISMLSKGFAAEREKLEQQWHRGEDVSTEDLRLVLRRYRSFFERLLSI